MSEKDANSFQKCALLPARMADTPRTRVRQRIKRLLEDRGKTQRALARFLGHSDQWASNLLRGEFTLSLDEIDRVAAFLNVPPSEIVRVSDDAWELSPSEMRVIRSLRMLPPPVRDHLVTLADYLVGVTPEEVELLNRIRALTVANMQVVDRWIEMKLFEQVRGPGALDHVDLPETATTPVKPIRRTRAEIRK